MSNDPQMTLNFRDRDGDEFTINAIDGGLVQIQQNGNGIIEFYATDAHKITDGIVEAVRLAALSGSYPVSEPDK